MTAERKTLPGSRPGRLPYPPGPARHGVVNARMPESVREEIMRFVIDARRMGAVQ